MSKLESAIRKRNEDQVAMGLTDLETTCGICLKTKFANTGVGRHCNYCGTKCCAKCGGMVLLRSGKVGLKSWYFLLD